MVSFLQLVKVGEAKISASWKYYLKGVIYTFVENDTHGPIICPFLPLSDKLYELVHFANVLKVDS